MPPPRSFWQRQARASALISVLSGKGFVLGPIALPPGATARLRLSDYREFRTLPFTALEAGSAGAHTARRTRSRSQTSAGSLSSRRCQTMLAWNERTSSGRSRTRQPERPRADLRHPPRQHQREIAVEQQMRRQQELRHRDRDPSLQPARREKAVEIAAPAVALRRHQDRREAGQALERQARPRAAGGRCRTTSTKRSSNRCSKAISRGSALSTPSARSKAPVAQAVEGRAAARRPQSISTPGASSRDQRPDPAASRRGHEVGRGEREHAARGAGIEAAGGSEGLLERGERAPRPARAAPRRAASAPSRPGPAPAAGRPAPRASRRSAWLAAGWLRPTRRPAAPTLRSLSSASRILTRLRSSAFKFIVRMSAMPSIDLPHPIADAKA